MIPQDREKVFWYFEIWTQFIILVVLAWQWQYGLEERFPFMDNDLVEFAMKIPVKHKLAILRRRLKKLMKIIQERKNI